MRTFFALPVSVNAEQNLSALADDLRDSFSVQRNEDLYELRWIRPANYHITLAFLGNIERRDVQRLHDIAISTVGNSFPAQLQVSGVEWFPSPSKPRLIVATVEPHQALIDLQKYLVRALRQQGFNIEKKAFRPHISLARGRVSHPPTLDDVWFEPTSTDFDELVLYQSQLTSSGAIYSPLFVEAIGATLHRR